MSRERHLYANFQVVGLEEALQTLTHVCRERPSLRIRPDHCSRRMTAVYDGSSFDPYWQCRSCDGPIQVEDALQVDVLKPSKSSAIKVCIKCKKPKKASHDKDSEYYTDTRQKDNFMSICKSCRQARKEERLRNAVEGSARFRVLQREET